MIPPVERFWSKVDKSGPVVRSDLGECWVWKGSRSRFGYGRFPVEHRRQVYAHRFAYELAYGPIVLDLLVCHRCDNPPCVNPDHLFLGDNSDNIADRQSKNRQARREQIVSNRRQAFADDHLSAKVPAATISLIRSMHAAGKTRREIASTLDLARMYVSDVVAGRRRKHG